MSGKRTDRPRTRLNPDARREQLMDAAAGIAREGGLSDVSIRTVAHAAGISEAQVHNCFGGRTDLLIALARREIAAISARRGVLLTRGKSRRTRIVISTLNYLHEADEHGPLLQRLLRDPEVRLPLSREWEVRRSRALDSLVNSLTTDGDGGTHRASASMTALTAISLRAGGIVAARRAPFETVERLCIAMMLAGIDSNARMLASLQQTPAPTHP